MKQHRSHAERWKRDAQLTGSIPAELIHLGARLIEQAELDRRYHDDRLHHLLGADWYERMIRFASRSPGAAQRVWRYMLEHRRLPPR